MEDLKCELEVHVRAYQHQRSLRGSELSLVTIVFFFFFFEKPAKPTGALLKQHRNIQGTSKTTNWAMSEGKSPSHSLVSAKPLAFLAKASATTL